jgi:ectoine hydroxylase-related dioxygenase (phytanoyl-CoA dioxygenase family)
MLAATFKDPQLEQEINENGYVVIPGFLPEEDVQKLLAVYRGSHNERVIGCWNSLYDLPTGSGAELSAEITAVAKPHLAKLFDNWQFPIALFIVKNPGQEHASLVHRDDTMHNEDEVQYRQCWVPLVDLTPENGALYMVPRSHKLFTDSRPMFAKWPYENLRPRLEKEFVTLYAKAGDLIVYLDKTLHGSYKNVGSETRPVFQGGIMHKDAVPLYTRYVAERNEVDIYQVDPEFFFNKEYMNPVIDPKYPLIRTEKYQPTEITEAELEDFFAVADVAK